MKNSTITFLASLPVIEIKRLCETAKELVEYLGDSIEYFTDYLSDFGYPGNVIDKDELAALSALIDCILNPVGA